MKTDIPQPETIASRPHVRRPATPLPRAGEVFCALLVTEAVLWVLFVVPKAIASYQLHGQWLLTWRRLGIPLFALPYALLLSVPVTLVLHAGLRRHQARPVLPVLILPRPL